MGKYYVDLHRWIKLPLYYMCDGGGIELNSYQLFCSIWSVCYFGTECVIYANEVFYLWAPSTSHGDSYLIKCIKTCSPMLE